MDNTGQHLLPGDLLIGFCGGAFGRDAYFDKTVEAVGEDWIVIRDVDGRPEFASGEDIHSRLWEYCERNEGRDK